MAPSWFALPRPRSFLFITSLRFGAEMISLSLLFNKLAGFYGILALVTGYRLSFLQFSMYLYSLIALVILVTLMPHIRKSSPLQCLSLAYFYLIDTILNGAYTAVFAGTWFLTLSAAAKDAEIDAPGSETMSDTAGFTNSDASSISDAAAAAGGSPSLANGAAISESVPSILIIVFLTLVRVYFALVLFSFARQVLRQYLSAKSSQRPHLHMDGADDKLEEPFAEGTPLGAGWKGKLGRAMTAIGTNWWVGGRADDEEWARSASQKFVSNTVLPGTSLREQRARSGTGPPPMRIQTQAPM
ncbi:hypothetical protein V491_08340 [Pseudogymnoascus sp. VKM F-3775]|nr:hypothetical protein V491_08340 [Pseudogymnoascus sp. VKM F-3775]